MYNKYCIQKKKNPAINNDETEDKSTNPNFRGQFKVKVVSHFNHVIKWAQSTLFNTVIVFIVFLSPVEFIALVNGIRKINRKRENGSEKKR